MTVPVSRREELSDSIQRLAFTVAEFCTAHRISRALYYELKKRGEGPAEMHAKNKILISVEAAERWRREREAATKGSTQHLRRRKHKAESGPGFRSP